MYVQRRPVRLLRTSFNALCALLLAGVFGWSAGWLESERGLWVLSAGTGIMYGAIFTLTVSRPVKYARDKEDPDANLIAGDSIGALRSNKLRFGLGNDILFCSLWSYILFCE